MIEAESRLDPRQPISIRLRLMRMIDAINAKHFETQDMNSLHIAIDSNIG